MIACLIDSASSSTLLNVCQTILAVEQKSKSTASSPLKLLLENFIKKSGRLPQHQKQKKPEVESKITFEDKLRIQVWFAFLYLSPGLCLS